MIVAVGEVFCRDAEVEVELQPGEVKAEAEKTHPSLSFPRSLLG